jgi:hypothetical protein
VVFCATFKAEWSGDVSYPAASITKTLSFLPYENRNVFFFESNSTVTALAFNSNSSEFSFTVSGPDGTTGYVKAAIAKSLVSNAENIKVYLEGKQLSYAITSSADSWQLDFTYGHSEHRVRISLAASTVGASDYWMLIGAVIIIAITAVVGFIFWQKKKNLRPREN